MYRNIYKDVCMCFFRNIYNHVCVYESRARVVCVSLFCSFCFSSLPFVRKEKKRQSHIVGHYKYNRLIVYVILK